MTTSVTDMEVLKEIPGYKAIMKAVLKTQIQLLVEQLSDHTGEESIVLTASVNDGSLSHLGSCTGKGFLDGRDEIKSQFLGYCLKSHHKRKTAEPAAPYQRSNVSNVPGPRSSVQQTAKRPRLHPVSLSRVSGESEVPEMNMPSDTSSDGMYTSTPVQNRPRSQRGSLSDSSGGPPRTLSTDSRTNVKLEQSGDTLEGDISVQPSDTGTDFTAAASLPSSIGLSHTQTSESVSQGQGEKDLSNVQAGHGEASQSPGIKVEPVAESELDLEITGIELGDSTSQISSENWGQNVSGGAMGFGPGTADGSFEQTDNQSGYRQIVSNWGKAAVGGTTSYEAVDRNSRRALASTSDADNDDVESRTSSEDYFEIEEDNIDFGIAHDKAGKQKTRTEAAHAVHDGSDDDLILIEVEPDETNNQLRQEKSVPVTSSSDIIDREGQVVDGRNTTDLSASLDERTKAKHHYAGKLDKDSDRQNSGSARQTPIGHPRIIRDGRLQKEGGDIHISEQLEDMSARKKLMPHSKKSMHDFSKKEAVKTLLTVAKSQRKRQPITQPSPNVRENIEKTGETDLMDTLHVEYETRTIADQAKSQMADTECPADLDAVKLEEPPTSTAAETEQTDEVTDGVRIRFRDRYWYSRDEKAKILQVADEKGITQAAAEYDVPKSTVRGWRRLRELARKRKTAQVKFGTPQETSSGTAASVKDTKGRKEFHGRKQLYKTKVELKLIEWIREKHKRKEYLSGDMIRKYVLSLVKEKLPNFKASNGWLNCFLTRNNLKVLVTDLWSKRSNPAEDDQKRQKQTRPGDSGVPDRQLQPHTQTLAKQRYQTNKGSHLEERGKNKKNEKALVRNNDDEKPSRAAGERGRLAFHGPYSQEKKAEILEMAEKKGLQWTAEKYNCSVNSISRWRRPFKLKRLAMGKGKSKLTGFSDGAKRGYSTGEKRRQGRQVTYGKNVEIMILKWIIEQGKQQVEVTGEMIRNYVLKLVRDKMPNFKASDGWLRAFLKRNNLIMHVTKEGP